MSNFCPNCGRALAEGETCNCTNEAAPIVTPQQGMPQPAPQAAPQQGIPQPAPQAAPQQGIPQPMPQGAPQQGMPVQPQQYQYQGMPQGVPYTGVPYPTQQQPKQPSAVGVFFKKFLNTFLSVLKTPVTAGRTFVASADYMQAGAYILAQALLAALFGLIFEARLGSVINKAFSGWYHISMPYAKVIFGTFGLSIVLSAALAGLLLAASLIFKNKTNYQTMLCLTALRSMVIAPVTVVAIIVALINPFAGAVVFFAANIGAIILMTMCMPTYNPKSSEYVPWYLFLAFFVFLIVSILIMYVCKSLYLPADVQSLLSLF